MASNSQSFAATCFAGQKVESILFQRTPRASVGNFPARTVGGARRNEEWRSKNVCSRNLVTSDRNMGLPFLAYRGTLRSGRHSSECKVFQHHSPSLPDGEFPRPAHAFQGLAHSTHGQNEPGILLLDQDEGGDTSSSAVPDLLHIQIVGEKEPAAIFCGTDSEQKSDEIRQSQSSKTESVQESAAFLVLPTENDGLAPISYLHDSDFCLSKPTLHVTAEHLEAGPVVSDRNSHSRSKTELSPSITEKLPASISTTWQAALMAGLQSKSRAKDIAAELDELSKLERLELKPAREDDAEGDGISDVLHIAKNLEDKRILITGATGFLAKVLVEKILRTQPRIGQLYLLVRESKKMTIQERTVDGIFSCSLFKPLREEYGDQKFVELILRKVTPVSGDIGKAGLDLSPGDAELLMRDLDIIVSSAATTKFDERYDKAVEINTLGPLRLLELAKQCPKLVLFQHISTAYVNGRREGVCKEVPFQYGQSLLKEIYQGESNKETLKCPKLDPEGEVELAMRTRDELRRKYGLENGQSRPKIAQGLVKLGTERAKMFGWSDTYTFSKAMGEQILMKHRGDVPVVIVRPSVVESTVRSPFDGWIEGQRMLDPIVTAYGKGFLKGFLVDPETVLDVIPADIVVNVVLAAIVKHAGYMLKNPIIYQVASSVLNPMTMRKVADACYDHFRNYPMVSKKDKHQPATRIHVNYCVFVTSEAVFRFLVTLFFDLPLKVLNSLFLVNDKRFSKTRIALKFNYESITNLAETYKPYVFYKGRFDATNSERLLSQIWEEEKQLFGYSVKDVNWYCYLNQSHLPGLRQHVLGWKQTGAVDPEWTIIDPLPKRDVPPAENKLRPPSGGLYQLPIIAK
ncbi:hypothetical protein R1flu_010200 [Riccia fluitans]|uniref:Fatty acyl-CoA reductase n=1 Tax=Riccia fluitans TaxID=41844 RepID=A0ABD1Z4A8_9MARC